MAVNLHSNKAYCPNDFFTVSFILEPHSLKLYCITILEQLICVLKNKVKHFPLCCNTWKEWIDKILKVINVSKTEKA